MWQNKLKINYFISSIVLTVIIVATNQTVTAQLENSSLSPSLVINEKYGHRNIYNNATSSLIETPATVYVNYESSSSILISGELINQQFSRFNSDLWEAMDLLKNQYGFKLQNVMTSGVGSVGNPTVVYILMTKWFVILFEVINESLKTFHEFELISNGYPNEESYMDMLGSKFIQLDSDKWKQEQADLDKYLKDNAN